MYILARLEYAGYDWLILGITKLLVIIAMLQLVKKLPELINTIFGTNIKTKGGIKGRLGEMAGIGGIAQKAWSSLGAGARNLAKAGLTLPAAAAAFGANAYYKNKTGKNLTDIKGVRGLRGVGTGLSSAWKTGSVTKAFEAGKSAFEKTNEDPLDKARMVQRTKGQAKDINNRYGTTDANGIHRAVTEANDVKNKFRALDEYNDEISRVGGTEVGEKNKALQNATAVNNSVQTIKNKMEDVVTKTSTVENNLRMARRTTEADRIKAAREKFIADGDTSSLIQSINRDRTLFDPTVYDSLVERNGSVTAIDKERAFIQSLQQENNELGRQIELSPQMLINISKGQNAVGYAAKILAEDETAAKTALDIAIAGSKPSGLEKTQMETLVTAQTEVANTIGFGVSRDDSGLSSNTAGSVTNNTVNNTTVNNANNTNTNNTNNTNNNNNNTNTNNTNNNVNNANTNTNNSNVVSSQSEGNSSAFSNNTGSSNDSGSSNKNESAVKDDKVKIDSSELEETIRDVGSKITSSVEAEHQSTRDAINDQGNANKKAAEDIKGTLDDINSKLKPKE